MHIGIVASVSARHNYGEVFSEYIPFYGGESAPDCMVIAHAVEEIHNSASFIFSCICFSSDMCSISLWQNNVHHHMHAECIGKEVALNKCHDQKNPFFCTVSDCNNYGITIYLFLKKATLEYGHVGQSDKKVSKFAL